MFIIIRNVGQERELSNGKLLLVFRIIVVNFSHTHGDQQLLITSRSGVLRPSSDNSKDETHMIFLLMHTGKIFLSIQSFHNKHKTEAEFNIPGMQ